MHTDADEMKLPLCSFSGLQTVHKRIIDNDKHNQRSAPKTQDLHRIK